MRSEGILYFFVSIQTTAAARLAAMRSLMTSYRMSPLEIISRLCDVTENLSAIVKKQQTIIEQSKIEEAVRAELRQEVEETDREMDVLEYHMRKYCDTDDIEATEFGKENAVDD